MPSPPTAPSPPTTMTSVTVSGTWGSTSSALHARVMSVPARQVPRMRPSSKGAEVASTGTDTAPILARARVHSTNSTQLSR